MKIGELSAISHACNLRLRWEVGQNVADSYATIYHAIAK